MTTKPETSVEPTQTPVHWPCLLVGVGLMLVGSVYPIVFANAAGHADHGIATLLFWAMSAGLVRGIGFIPRHVVWRVLFSSWACAIGLLGAAVLRFA